MKTSILLVIFLFGLNCFANEENSVLDLICIPAEKVDEAFPILASDPEFMAAYNSVNSFFLAIQEKFDISVQTLHWQDMVERCALVQKATKDFTQSCPVSENLDLIDLPMIEVCKELIIYP